MQNILSPSILAADFWRLGEEISAVERAGGKVLHVDVMDGVFVPSISFGMPVLRSIRKCTRLFLDVHLMIEKPERYIEEFADCGADLINFHLEATQDPMSVIAQIRARGRKVGITIKPATPISALEPYLEKVDMVLVMTVEPGFGGQALIPECLEKVRQLRTLARERKPELAIEVDGGVKLSNLGEVLNAGANVIVAGSAVFGGDTEKKAGEFLSKLQTGSAVFWENG